MQRVRFGLVASLLLAGPSAAQQTLAAERQVSLPAETGLVVAHQEREGRGILVELVPEGETVENYSRMVTLQTAPDTGNIPEDAFLREFGERYGAACPNTGVTEVPFGSDGASGLRLDCPRHPATDRMETVFVRVMDLGRDLAIVQITMRFFPMPSDGAWARDYLGRVSAQ
jgi:hypothetical protein